MPSCIGNWDVSRRLDDGSRMSREAHVRFCEGLRVKLPRSTHPYITTGEGWLYLAGVKDVCTCELVGYAMGDRMTQELTGQALFRAVQRKRPSAGLIHHSDRGSQYCAHDYQKLLQQFGMTASMSRRGNCYDNAPMESFWGSLKSELVYNRRYATRKEAEASIQEYIEIFYNRQRRHSRLGYHSPAAFAQKFTTGSAAA
jgi:putative transposase